jgi:serine/threonine-protein kinase RsbW
LGNLVFNKIKRTLLVEIDLNIISDYAAVPEISRAIRGFLSDQNVEDHLCNAVEICLVEALNNIIKHAYLGDHTKQIDINVRKDNEFLELRMIDEGKPRDSLVINELNFDPEDIENLPEGGMGLFIIKQLMDEMDYYTVNGKNYFTLKKWFY